MSGESKQIDEDENGPENGGLKSGPCLIAGFHALSCTSPSYYNPYRGVNKNTLSVDMVRLSLTFKGDRGEQLRETLRSFDPSLPRLGAGKLLGALNAAQSSIQSLLDAQEQREQLERQLRSLETASGR